MDVYALGATLFHLLAGRPPFLGESAVEIITHHLQTAPPDPRQLVPSLRPAT